MIEKPKGNWQHDWQREDRTIQAARQIGGAASKALSAGSSGLARAQALYAGVLFAILGLMSGFAAVSAGLVGGNMPTFFGAGSIAVGLLVLAQRSLRKAFGSRPNLSPLGRPQSRQLPATAQPGFGSGICYDRSKLVWRIAGVIPVCGVLAAAVAFRFYRSPGLMLMLWASLGFFVWTLLALIRRALAADLTAIAWDDGHLHLRTLYASRRVPWDKVKSIGVKRTVRRIYGLIPISTTHTLVFELHRWPWARAITIPLSLLSLRPGALEDLARTHEGGFAPSFAPPSPSPAQAGPGEPDPVRPQSMPEPASLRPFRAQGPAPRPFGRKGTQPGLTTPA